MIPYGLVTRDVASRAAALNFDTLHEDVARFWRSVVNTPCRIRTPDPFVNDYLAATAGQIAEQIGYRHKAKLWMLKTSPNWYEDYYLSCAARALPSLDLRGLERYSRPVLQSIVDFQSDDPAGLLVDRQAHKAGIEGSEGFLRHRGFLGNFGLPGTAVPVGDQRQGWSANTSLMNHGLALWALAAHYRITRDKQWLGDGPQVAACKPSSTLAIGSPYSENARCGKRWQEGSAMGPAAGGFRPRLALRQRDLQRCVVHFWNGRDREIVARNRPSALRRK